MQLTIALEQRFYRTPDGQCWTASLYPHSFWSRYLAVFDGVRVLARVHESHCPADTWQRVDGEGVKVAGVPAYVGPWNFACRFRHVRSAIRNAVAGDSALLLRVPGMISTLAYWQLEAGRPYGVEVVGDPREAFASGANPHPLRPVLRCWSSNTLQAQCKHAACNLYVTEHALQRRYPPIKNVGGETRSVFGVSDAELPDSAFVGADDVRFRTLPPAHIGRNGRFRIIFVGTLEVDYKGLDVLITAFAKCIREGLDAELVIIGSGRRRPRFEYIGTLLGVSERLAFLGSLPAGEPIRRQLDAADLFVLPSRTEGLPRILLEAMARGIACVGTRVGGVPELLPNEALVAPGNADELRDKILQVAANPIARNRMASANLATARRYHEQLLQPKRIAFYRYLHRVTTDWQRTTRQSSSTVLCSAR